MTRLAHPVEEAAELLGCKASWLREQARLRKVPFTMLSGAYHFTDKHLEWIVERFEETPRPAAAAPAPRRRKKTTAEQTVPSTRLRTRPSRRLQRAG